MPYRVMANAAAWSITCWNYPSARPQTGFFFTKFVDESKTDILHGGLGEEGVALCCNTDTLFLDMAKALNHVDMSLLWEESGRCQNGPRLDLSKK